MADFESLDKKLQGRYYMSRKLGNNTYLKRLNGRGENREECIGVLLHSTYILRYYKDRCVIDCCGCRSVTTKARLREYWPSYGRHLYVWTHCGSWCWYNVSGSQNKAIVEFLDEDTIKSDGELVLTGSCRYVKRSTIEELEEQERARKSAHRRDMREKYKEYFQFKDTCYKMAARVRKLSPEKWTPDMIKWLRNAELKRRVITHFGWDKVQKALGGETIHKQGDMELVRMSGFATPESPFRGRNRGEYRTPIGRLLIDVVLLKVVCPSTGSSYCLRVPPEMLVCEEARRWTLGDNGNELELIVET